MDEDFPTPPTEHHPDATEAERDETAPMPEPLPDKGSAEELLALNRDLVARYRAALLASDPAIEPALVAGESADEVEASFVAAQRLVAGIRDAVRREHTPPVPAGAPGRAATGPHTAYDKIRAGLSRI